MEAEGLARALEKIHEVGEGPGPNTEGLKCREGWGPPPEDEREQVRL